jgi:hypothetical protein
MNCSHIFLCNIFAHKLHDLPECNIYVSLKMNYTVIFEVFTAVTMKNDVCWDVTLCDSCKNRREKNRRARNNVSSN